jgi:hypothetical protein
MTVTRPHSRPDLHRVKLANIRSKLPAEGAEEVLAHVRAVRDAPTLEAGEQAAGAVIERFGDRYPAAMAGLADDLEVSLAHLRLPVRHRISVRTTDERVRDIAILWDEAPDLSPEIPGDQGPPLHTRHKMVELEGEEPLGDARCDAGPLAPQADQGC